MLPKLDNEDYEARRIVCYDLIKAINNENFLDHILFSDKAIFHTCGKVNKHNCCIWDSKPPHATFEWQKDSPKVNVLLVFTKITVYAGFMFAEHAIMGNIYLDMLKQCLEPQLQQDSIVGSVVF